MARHSGVVPSGNTFLGVVDGEPSVAQYLLATRLKQLREQAAAWMRRWRLRGGGCPAATDGGWGRS